MTGTKKTRSRRATPRLWSDHLRQNLRACHRKLTETLGKVTRVKTMERCSIKIRTGRCSRSSMTSMMRKRRRTKKTILRKKMRIARRRTSTTRTRTTWTN